MKKLFVNLKKFVARLLHKFNNLGMFKSLIIGVIILLIPFYWFILRDLPNPASLKNYKVVPVSTQILDRNEKTLFEIFRDQNRVPIKLSALPKYVGQAAIAIEDKDFYTHGGISIFSGVFRAARDMIFGSSSLQGGSTITQQLVKSALLIPDRTIQRKIREIILAVWSEQIFTKDEILELYLNQIPYGGSSYGIEEAAKTFFGKHAKDLTIAQSAYLAGLPQAPTYYSPYINPDRAINRQREVLLKMYEQKYLTSAQYEKEKNVEIKITPVKNSIKAPHFVFYVRQILEEQYGIQQVEEGGLKVTTTLDYDIQASAEAIVKDEVDKAKALNVSNGALLVTRPPTGEILSMVGSKDYFASPSGTFNVTTAMRQPGSTIKPVNYAIGIDRKIVTAASVFLDTSTCFPNPTGKAYCPVNYDGNFYGPVQLRFALGNSLNIPAVKMMAINGLDNFAASSPAFLISSFSHPEKYGLSVTLGGAEMTMVELSQAFSTFANQGTPKKLVAILKVEDKKGNVLYEWKDPNYVKDVKKPLKYPDTLGISGKRAISPETAFIISHILLDNYARSTAFGTDSLLVIRGKNVSVKTGTTDDKRDNWTVGYTPNFLVSVWVGNNDNKPMNPYLASGITGAAPIWNRTMKMVLENQLDLMPKKPAGVVDKSVCFENGTATTAKLGDVQTGCSPRFEYFIKGTEPRGLEIKKEMVSVNRDNGKLARSGDTNVEMQEKTIMKDAYSTYCLDCAHEEIKKN